jgi:hypothetical protein
VWGGSSTTKGKSEKRQLNKSYRQLHMKRARHFCFDVSESKGHKSRNLWTLTACICVVPAFSARRNKCRQSQKKQSRAEEKQRGQPNNRLERDPHYGENNDRTRRPTRLYLHFHHAHHEQWPPQLSILLRGDDSAPIFSECIVDTFSNFIFRWKTKQDKDWLNIWRNEIYITVFFDTFIRR